MASSLSVAKTMDEKPKICENFCTHKPQPRVEYTPFLNGDHSPADRAGGLFKPAINGLVV